MRKVVTLIQLREGTKAKVISFALGRGGRFGARFGRGMGQAFARRLQEMGIIPGSTIEVIRNASVGPVEVSVMGTHLAIGRSIASRIYVEEL